jgi:hypothetical protein
MKFAIYCALLLAGFVGLELGGVNLFPASEHVVVPASVRSSPGGYRSFHFWHSGFHGGK